MSEIEKRVSGGGLATSGPAVTTAGAPIAWGQERFKIPKGANLPTFADLPPGTRELLESAGLLQGSEVASSMMKVHAQPRRRPDGSLSQVREGWHLSRTEFLRCTFRRALVSRGINEKTKKPRYEPTGEWSVSVIVDTLGPALTDREAAFPVAAAAAGGSTHVSGGSDTAAESWAALPGLVRQAIGSAVPADKTGWSESNATFMWLYNEESVKPQERVWYARASSTHVGVAYARRSAEAPGTTNPDRAAVRAEEAIVNAPWTVTALTAPITHTRRLELGVQVPSARAVGASAAPSLGAGGPSDRGITEGGRGALASGR